MLYYSDNKNDNDDKSRLSNSEKRLIAIGPAIEGSNGQINGQAMMFQLTVDVLREKGWSVRVCNIIEKRDLSDLRVNGGFTLLRMIDYMKLIPKIWLRLLFSRKCIVYLATAQSKMGFLRDMCIIWAVLLRGDSLVCHQFGGDYGGFYNAQSGFIRFLIRKTLDRASRIIVEGEFVKEQFSFLNNYKQKVNCLTNCHPERSLKIAEKAKEIDPGKPFQMIYLSNMIETKGYLDVLKSVKVLKDRNRNVICKFAGRFMCNSSADKEYNAEQSRQSFFQYIKDNGLSDYISYDESLFGKEKFDAFIASHLFLLPSNYIYEGQPVSILEAMAHGIVTVATKYRLIPVMVQDDDTGFFVPYGDPEAIAGKVEFLMDNPNEYKRLSRNSIDRFNKNFRAEAYVDEITAVFVDILR